MSYSNLPPGCTQAECDGPQEEPSQEIGDPCETCGAELISIRGDVGCLKCDGVVPMEWNMDPEDSGVHESQMEKLMQAVDAGVYDPPEAS